MALIRIDRHPPPRKLRFFGLIWLLAFGFLGYLSFQRRGLELPTQALWALALTIPAIGWLYLPLLRWAWIALATVTFPIGWVISHLVLALVYFCVITPIGLLRRLAGRDPMQRRFDASASSYWIERQATPDPRRYFRQF